MMQTKINLFPQLQLREPVNPFTTLQIEEFQRQFIIDENYGVCYASEQVPRLVPQQDQLENYCKNLHTYIEKGTVVIEIDKMLESLYLIRPTQNRLTDVQIFGMMIYLLNSYLFSQEKPPQVLRKEIAVPLYLLSKALDVKPSMGWIQNMGNWRGHGDLFDINNLSCQYKFTTKRDEEVFFLVSNMADFRFAKVITEIFKVNKILGALFNQIYEFESIQNKYQCISTDPMSPQEKALFQWQFMELISEQIDAEVTQCLKIMKEQMEKITASLKVMFEFNDPDFFFGTLRMYLKGFQDENMFPNGLRFEEIEETFFSEGGSGGNSPSFQIFERSLGIKFNGGMELIQQSMREGMIKEHKELILMTQRYSYIRAYCDLSDNSDLKQSFNDVIRAYIEFNKKHFYYITYYIERSITKRGGDPTNAQGTGGVPLNVMKTKHEMFNQFLIEA